MANLTAWLMDFGHGYRAATGERLLVHVVPAPVLADIPRAPIHCRRVLVWENRLLPAWDVAAFLDAPPLTSDRALAALAAYRVGADTGKVRLGALLLPAPPVRIAVLDPRNRELPDPRWRAIAKACFEHHEEAVPILDLARMFETRPNAEQERAAEPVLAAA